MHADAAPATLAPFDLAGVDGGPHLEAQPADDVVEREGAAQRPGRCVEGGHDPVAGALDVLAHPSVHLRLRHLEVPVHKLAPGAIAHLGGLGGRLDDVGEQDRGQDAVRVLGGPQGPDLLIGPVVFLGVLALVGATASGS